MKKCISIMLAAVLSVSAVFSSVSVYAEEKAAKITRIYVSPNGNDSNNGSEESPVATIEAARDIVRKIEKRNPIEILIHAGTYKLEKRIELTSDDSGSKTAPITYKAYGDGDVILSGAKRIDLSKFTAITDKSILERLPASSRGRVGQVNLKEQGFTQDELTMRNYEGASPFGANYNVWNTPMVLGLYLNDYEQRLSRWPNKGYLTIGNIIGNDTFEYTEQNPSRWTKAKDAFIAGYMYSEWTGGWQPIKSIDTDNARITVVTGGESVKANHRWSAINLLEEIDIPGEWYLDRENLILYYYPEKYIDPENDVLEFGVLGGTNTAGAINVKNCSYITFDGLQIEKTYCSGIRLDSCSDITVKNCYIHDVGGIGIQSENFGKRIVVENNTVANCTDMCIQLNYQKWSPYPIEEWKNLEYTGNTIRNNHMYNAARGRYGMVYASCLEGIGSVYEHNIVHGGINSLASNNAPMAVTRYNELYNGVRETADAGAIYCGRRWQWYGAVTEYNYIHDIGDREFDADNLVDCIFWDDSISGQTARYNILRPNSKTRTYGIVSGGGRDNTITSNIIVDSAMSIDVQDRTTGWPDGRKDDFWEMLVSCVTDMKGSEYLKKFPQIERTYNEINADTQRHAFKPDNNNISNNVIVNAADINYSNYEKNNTKTSIKQGNYVGKDTSIFVDPENQDYRVKKEKKKELGLDESVLDEDFDINLIGIQGEVPTVTDDKFLKTYPKNGDKGLDYSGVTLAWQKAPFADEYDYVVAKDPEMKEVVLSGTTIYTNVQLGKLEKNTSYYWTVKAKNISRQIGKEWEADGAVYKFTTAGYDFLDSSLLKLKLKSAETFANGIEEGTEMGQYKLGTKQRLLDKIEELKIIAGMTSGEQVMINNAVSELTNAVETAKSSINIRYNGTIDTSDASLWQTTTPDSVKISCEDGSIKLDCLENSIAATKQEYSGSGVYTFDMKSSAENGWFAFGLRHSNIDSTNIYSAGNSTQPLNTVFIIVKNDVFELQTRNSASAGNTVFITAENNGVFKNNEWNRIEFGCVPGGSGIYCTLKVNDKVVFEYIDTINPVRTEGVFCVQPIRDVPMYIRAVPDAPVGEFKIPEEVLNNTAAAEKIYTTESVEYTETGSWSISPKKGYDNKSSRMSDNKNSAAMFDLMPDANKTETYDVYYYNVPTENGDKNATLALSNLYVSYERSFDTTAGEEGWRYIGTYQFVDESARARMNIKLIPSGEGELLVSAVKIIKSTDDKKAFTDVFSKYAKNAVVLKVGNETAYKDAEKINVDSPPVISDSRTLVPVRFISESFGASVNWNEEEKRAEITADGKTIVFNIGAAEYSVNGETRTLDVPPSVINDRTMIPLRALCEALGKEVLWIDASKIIVVADTISLTDKDSIVNACTYEYNLEETRQSEEKEKQEETEKREEEKSDEKTKTEDQTPISDETGGQPPLIKADNDNLDIDEEKENFVIGFIGGSLTQGGGTWIGAVKRIFMEKYPDKNIITLNAGIGGTGSDMGAVRYEKDILSHNPDLVFIEFAINDKGADDKVMRANMESMIRRSLECEKIPCIIFLYAPDPAEKNSDSHKLWEKGVLQKEKLAEYYGIKSIDIYDYMYNEFLEKKAEDSNLTFTDYLSEYYNKSGNGFDVHGGYQKYAEAIKKAFEEDFDSCMTKPRNEAGIAVNEGANDKYRMIYATSPKMHYTGGDWKLYTKNNGYNGNVSGHSISGVMFDYPYFPEGVYQTENKDAMFGYETTPGTKQICVSFVSTSVGASASVTVDGKSAGTVSCNAIYENVNYLTDWIDIPDDGQKHKIIFKVDGINTQNSVFRFGGIYEKY